MPGKEKQPPTKPAQYIGQAFPDKAAVSQADPGTFASCVSTLQTLIHKAGTCFLVSRLSSPMLTV